MSENLLQEISCRPEVRSRIFQDKYPEMNRRTSRLKSYYAEVKRNKKIQISTVFNNSTDLRSYAEVSFLQYKELGLLDTGANISCIGAELALQDFSKLSEYKPLKSRAKTAGGENQTITGFLDTEISYNNIKKPMRLYITPSIKQKLILGHDFWRIFQIAPNIISSLQASNEISELSGENLYPLTATQSQQLAVVKQFFPKASDG